MRQDLRFKNMTSALEIDQYMATNKDNIMGGLKFIGVFASDKLPSLNSTGVCFIVNYDPSFKGGSHWIAFSVIPPNNQYYDTINEPNNTVLYFDSYGEEPDSDNKLLGDDTKFRNYIASIPHSNYKYNYYDFQALNSDVCGLYAIYFCLYGLPEMPPKNKYWNKFNKAPHALISGNNVKLDAPLAKDNDNLIKSLIKIKETSMGANIARSTDLLYGQGFTQNKNEKQNSSIHSIVFNKDEWTTKSAREWLKDHNYIPIKHVDETINTYRYRIRDPKLFTRFTTEVLQNGINLVLGWSKYPVI